MPRFPFLFRLLVFCAFLLAVAVVAPGLRAQTTPDATQPPTAPESEMAQQVTDLQKIADRWDDAVGQRDQYALELVLAPQFIGIADTGEVRDRDQVVSQMLIKDAPRYSLTQKVISVREVGDVAVVNGTYDRVYQGSRLSHTKLKDQKGVFSQVYVRARNTWQCINSQRTIIAGTATTSKKKSKEASSDKSLGRDLGFHFPGIHHSSSQPQ